MIELWRYSKRLFILVALFILVQIYFTFKFAAFSYRVDHHQPITHPVAFESFPFVVYNMYSGKIDYWNKYSYLKLEADGEEVKLTDWPVNEEEEILNPANKFLDLKAQNFDDVNLAAFLKYSFDSASANRVYNKVANNFLKEKPNAWGIWLMDYLTKLICKDVHEVKIYNCVYRYDEAGKPVFMDQQILYQCSR